MLLQAYDDYLNHVCGLCESTRIYRRRYARAFLTHIQLRELDQINRVTPEQILGFIKGYASRYQSGSLGVVTSALKRFLSFLSTQGYGVNGLIASIPTLPNWSLSSVPNYLNEQAIKRFLAAFDRSTPVGRRDYAMAQCFVELGLRCSEVAYLRLQDIDWQNGIVSLSRNKSRRVDRLPLPNRVGEAIVDYLKHGRPRSTSQAVFLRHRPPRGKKMSARIVGNAMCRAHQRAGLGTYRTHILRHTFATRLLQRGTSLKDIADLLRHEHLDTTLIYTKVDLPQLRRVVMPWIGDCHENV